MSDFQTSCSFLKVDETHGLVFGFAVVCTEGGKDYYDLQGDHIPDDAMLKAALGFAASDRVSGDMHAWDEDGQPIADGKALFLFPMTTEIAKALGITTPVTGLLVGMRPSKSVLQKFKNGDYTGFSIGGRRVKSEEVE